MYVMRMRLNYHAYRDAVLILHTTNHWTVKSKFSLANIMCVEIYTCHEIGLVMAL